MCIQITIFFLYYTKTTRIYEIKNCISYPRIPNFTGGVAEIFFLSTNPPPPPTLYCDRALFLSAITQLKLSRHQNTALPPFDSSHLQFIGPGNLVTIHYIILLLQNRKFTIDLLLHQVIKKNLENVL